ncbi:protein of unknown function [Trichlorobacter ammonificans]|uniref:Uncharacterized protein n=1 Tax=Trichlorobacter ammonificans TaxID=2916410 RepID=A0ABN8HBC4_9BACT|nr:protein of unknown function [Trichlorobacter ammonificans]
MLPETGLVRLWQILGYKKKGIILIRAIADTQQSGPDPRQFPVIKEQGGCHSRFPEHRWKRQTVNFGGMFCGIR